MEPASSLPFAMFYLLGFMIFAYLILNGFDLGVGILSLFVQSPERRDILVSTIAPVWIANQTWLVVLTGTLFGCFPLVSAIIFSALYIPIMIMLVGLIIRTVAIEFYVRSENKTPWAVAFGAGSLLAALCQGFVVAGFLSGIPIQDSHFTGSPWFWVSVLSVLVTLFVVASYTLLGATYIIMRAGGEVRMSFVRPAMVSALCLVAALFVLMFWSARMGPETSSLFAAMTSSRPFYVFAFLFSMGLIMALWYLQKACAREPFLFSVIAFSIAGIGVVAGLYPYILPPLTILEAAAPVYILRGFLVAVGVLLPMVVIYSAYRYGIFQGKGPARQEE